MENRFLLQPQIDCHGHLYELCELDSLAGVVRQLNLKRMNLLALSLAFYDKKTLVNGNPAIFVAKARYPDLFYIFGCLDHANRISSPRITTPSLAEQLDRLIAIGVDGIKMIEGKPTERKGLDIPFDGEYYADFFAKLENSRLPLLWHVADPEEMWSPAATTASREDTRYDSTFVTKDDLYAEVSRVLRRHPKLRVIFAHFYFLSADLSRAAEFLDAHPNTYFDLAPGWEMYRNMSRNPEESRAFFIRYADRILLGTDILSFWNASKASAWISAMVQWLQFSETFTRRAGDEPLQGLGLPGSVLEGIFGKNFSRLAGDEPAPLNKHLAREECERIASETELFFSGGRKSNPAFDALAWLA